STKPGESPRAETWPITSSTTPSRPSARNNFRDLPSAVHDVALTCDRHELCLNRRTSSSVQQKIHVKLLITFCLINVTYFASADGIPNRLIDYNGFKNIVV